MKTIQNLSWFQGNTKSILHIKSIASENMWMEITLI